MGLFEPEITPLVWHRPGWLRGSALHSLERLRAELPLRQRHAVMYGKEVTVPRLECWFGKRPYAFGGRVEQPREMVPSVLALSLLVEAAAQELGALAGEGPAGQPFDSCFANLYRDGDDTIPWHADDEPWIGPVIASVTFGAARRFVMKHNATGTKVEYELGDGDLLVMGAGVQADWKHSVPRTAAKVGPRLNLTFRQTVEPDAWLAASSWRALSLWEPWASLIAHGVKTIETRSWPTDYRGSLLVHAAKRWTSEEAEAWSDFAEDFPGRFPALTGPAPATLGHVVATARLVHCMRFSGPEDGRISRDDHACGNVDHGRFGFALKEVRRLARPVPMRGMQGLWTPDADVVRQVEAQLA